MGYKEDIAAAKLQIREVTNDRIIDTVLRIHATLVSNPPAGTPVDFGWASASWFIGTNAPTTGNGGNIESGTESSMVAQREEEQSTTVANFVANYDYTKGWTAHVGNNVPYIRRLNFGWSTKSPAGFVEAAVQEAVRWANGQPEVKI